MRATHTFWTLVAIAIIVGVCVYAFFWLLYLSSD